MSSNLKNSMMYFSIPQVFAQVAEIYAQSGKLEQAEECHRRRLGKFKKELEVYVDMGLVRLKLSIKRVDPIIDDLYFQK